MEERTLEELNNEYKSLVEKVKQIKIELEKAIAEKETADGNYESASADFTEKKSTYEALEAGLKGIESSGFSNTLIEGMKNEIKAAKDAMEEAERVLKAREEEQKTAREGFEKIESDSKKESSRLDVIITSFGANKTINEAISNEIEIDYTEMIEEKQKEKTQIDDLKTKISSDSKIQEQVGELDTLLKRFEELKKNVTPENAAELAETGKQIKTKRDQIRRKMRSLGLKGGKISVEEIDKMTTEKDEQGRIVIAELDRRSDVADTEIANIELEKKELLDKMRASLEIGEQVEHDETKVKEVRADIEKLTAEKEALEKEQAERNANLAGIEKEKANLTEELNSLGTGTVNTAELDKLRADRAAIEAEVIEDIDNPKKAALKKQIEDLEAKKNAGVSADVETAEYKAAKKDYDTAVRALDREKSWPSTAFAVKTDVIIDNPDYIKASTELATRQKELSRITGAIVNSNPELKKLYDDYYKSKQQEAEIEDELQPLTGEMLKKKKELFGEYVNEEMYPELADENSQAYKDFDAYKQAELELRKAMIELQKDPSEANINALLAARENLNTATGTLQRSLADVAGMVTYPSPNAIHKYLLGKLRDDYDNYEPIDEAYDFNQAERRIAELESRTRRDEDGKENISNLRESSKGLEDALEEMLKGNAVDDRTLVELIAKHQENIAAFPDQDLAKSTLKGVDMEVADGRFGFLRRIISRFTTPKVEEDYRFPKNKEPKSKEEFEAMLDRQDELKEELDEARKQTKGIGEEYSKKMKEVASEEQARDMDKHRKEIDKLRATVANLPKKVNKTKLDKLTADVQKAEQKMKATPQYEQKVDTKAIDDQIAELTTQLNAEPDKIEDAAKVADKKRRIAEKDAEIDEAMIDATDPRRSEIRKLLEELNGREIEEKSKFEDVSSRLAGVMDGLKEKMSLLAMFEVAKQRIMNIIHIKDANRMLDRRSGRIAEDLVNATRPARPVKSEPEGR